MTNPHIWITRTLPGAHKSGANYASLGLACIISPLLALAPAAQMPPRPDKKALLIFTSQNGLNSFCDFTSSRDWPLVTVGDETAEQARTLGFKDVRSAAGTASDIIKLIKSNVPMSQPIIHCAGQHVRGNITKELGAAGYSIRRDIYYETHPVLKLPNLDVTKLNYIALYSPLAAKTLRVLTSDLSTVTTLSISEATDEALGNLKCQSRLVAKSPDETAMLALLGPSVAV